MSVDHSVVPTIVVVDLGPGHAIEHMGHGRWNANQQVQEPVHIGRQLNPQHL